MTTHGHTPEPPRGPANGAASGNGGTSDSITSAPSPPLALRFDSYELDFPRHELRRDGALIALQPTPLRVLLYLAEHRDRTVPRRELLDAVWPDVLVGDEALTTALAEARHAVGDDGAAQRVIRTLKGQGYRFVADAIERGSNGSAGRTSRALRTVLASGVLAAIVFAVFAAYLRRPELEPPKLMQPTVAVLKVANITGDAATQRIADGLTNEIVHALSIGSAPAGRLFNVIPPAAASTRDGADLRELGVSLGATHVFECSVRASDAVVRVDCNLVSVERGSTLWSNQYDRALGESFRIHEAIAQQVTSQLLGWHLAESIVIWLPREEADAIRAAMIAFMNGDFTDAVARAERLLASQPRSAAAHAIATVALVAVAGSRQQSHAEVAPRLDLHAKAAVALESENDPGLVAWAAAYAHVFHWSWSDAEREGRRACAVDVAAFCDPLLQTLLATGRVSESVPLLRQAVARVPMLASRRLMLAIHLHANGSLDDAARECTRANEIVGGSFDHCGVIAWDLGRRRHAVETARAFYESVGLEDVAAELGRLQVERGPEAAWRRIAEMDSAADPFKEHCQRAFLFAQLGHAEAALEALERSLAAHEASLPQYLALRAFDSMRDSPRFRAIVEDVGLAGYHAKHLKRQAVAPANFSPRVAE